MLKMNSNITNNETEYCQINTERPKQKNNIQLIIPHILPSARPQIEMVLKKIITNKHDNCSVSQLFSTEI